MNRPGRRGRGARPGRLLNLNGVIHRDPGTLYPHADTVLEPRRYTAAVGFNPYSRIRRARMTRRGDIAFLVGFSLLICAALAWAML